MPSYEYKCEDCNHTQTEFHPMKGPEVPLRCEKCHSKNLKLQISAVPGYVKGTNTPTRC
jgi:putative FmdB family regulatory protein